MFTFIDEAAIDAGRGISYFARLRLQLEPSPGETSATTSTETAQTTSKRTGEKLLKKSAKAQTTA
jgi:hypothetical protein